MKRLAPLSLCATLAGALVGGRARAADANGKEACISAAERGQQLRDDGKLQLAHAAFVQCARDFCPAVVKKDCGDWLREVDTKTPTVILKANDEAGADLTDVIVLMDDTSLAATLDGKPVSVDPGEHVFHFEASGIPPVEQRLSIRAGERNRVIQVKLAAPPSQPLAATTPPASEEAPPAPARAPAVEAPASLSSSAMAVPMPTWILGGVALAAFGSEAYFGLTALGDRDADLAPGGCSPHCGAAVKSSIQTRFAVADVSLGVGLVSAGLAAYFFFASKKAPESVAFDVAALPGGAVSTVGGRF